MYYTVYFVAIVKVFSLGCIHFSYVIFDDASPSVSRIVSEIAKKIEFNFQTSKAIYQGKDLKKNR